MALPDERSGRPLQAKDGAVRRGIVLVLCLSLGGCTLWARRGYDHPYPGDCNKHKVSRWVDYGIGSVALATMFLVAAGPSEAGEFGATEAVTLFVGPALSFVTWMPALGDREATLRCEEMETSSPTGETTPTKQVLRQPSEPRAAPGRPD